MGPDVAAGLAGLVQGGIGGYEQQQAANEAKARQAALMSLRQRELGQKDTALGHEAVGLVNKDTYENMNPEQAQAFAKANGIEWPQGQGMSNATASSITRKYGIDNPRPYNPNAGGGRKFDQGLSRTRATMAARQHFGIPKDLPISPEILPAFNDYVEKAVQADAKAAGANYEPPADVPIPMEGPGFLSRLGDAVIKRVRGSSASESLGVTPTPQTGGSKVLGVRPAQ